MIVKWFSKLHTMSVFSKLKLKFYQIHYERNWNWEKSFTFKLFFMNEIIYEVLWRDIVWMLFLAKNFHICYYAMLCQPIYKTRTKIICNIFTEFNQFIKKLISSMLD